MKTIALFSIILICGIVSAETTLSIGPDTFPFEFETGVFSEPFQKFVAKDVSCVFAPLRHITNVLDVAHLEQHPEQLHELTLREWYPESFLGGWNVTNRDGVVVFRMKSSLTKRYAEIFDGFGAISNRFSALESLMNEINNGSITNGPDAEMDALVFLPTGSTLTVTAEDIRGFLQTLSGMGPFSVSVLDCWNEVVQGENCLVSAAKTAILEDGKWSFVPVEWIYRGGQWRYYNPRFLETVNEP